MGRYCYNAMLSLFALIVVIISSAGCVDEDHNSSNAPHQDAHHHQQDGVKKEPGTELTTDPFSNLLVISTLDGTLTALDRVSGELRWISKDDKPMIQVPPTPGDSHHRTSTKAPYFLPDPKTGSLYMMGKQNSLRKLPFTIPQLVAMAPCRNSEGLMYTGRKMDMWLMLNPFTGEKSEIPEDGRTCPAWSQDSNTDSCSADSTLNRKQLMKSLVIGKTEYTLSMMDGPRKWNVTYHHYSSKDMNPQSLQDYDLVHFTSPSEGSLMTYNRGSGDLLWHRELDSPVIAMYSIDGTSTNLVSVPFNPIASDTLNRLKSADTTSQKSLSSTTYVGECEYGLYAVPALADEQVLMIGEGSTLPPLIEGPLHVDPKSSEESSNNAKQEDYLLLGYYEVNNNDGSGAMQVESDVVTFVTNSSEEFLDTGKVIPLDDEKKDGGGKIPLNKTPVQFPPPLERKQKEDIKIVLTTAVVSVGITSLILGLLFIAYRRYKNNQIEGTIKLLSSDVASNLSTKSEDGGGEMTVGKICFDPSQVLGKGCEGTFVFKGKFEGRDVAVKRILPECFQFADREVDLLKESDQHGNVIRYFCTETDGQFRYIALELCIATLHDWVEGKYSNDSISPCLVLKEATDGLAYLHSLRIVHRDVKPANVLLALSPGDGGVRTMISDFGLCKKIQNGRMSFSRRSGGIPGTDGWIAPEVIRDPGMSAESQYRMTYSVDIFSMGCVYYYVLTKGQHPFGDQFRRQSNILSGEYDLELIGNNPQGANDLIRMMISPNPSNRPPLSAVLGHPMFWSNDKILSFFLDVSDRVEKESEDTFPLLKRLESGAVPIVKNDWRDHICAHVAMDLRKYRTYKGHSIRDLLRALRNKKNHYRELTVEAQASLGHIPDQFVVYWVSRFPELLPYVWVRFEVLKDETVFNKYYVSGFEFFDLLVEERDEEGENDSTEVRNRLVEILKGGGGVDKNLGKDFWKSKSQVKYQKWRKTGGSPNSSPVRRFNELSAATDHHWRNSSPGRVPE